ncbi:hypothetical protein [Alysiella crassa]|nr:hypothetical protein [Alysiella crassa]UOP06953.1 hypothetical protein LVJ80_00140 [Alysiella crassa]
MIFLVNIFRLPLVRDKNHSRVRCAHQIRHHNLNDSSDLVRTAHPT